MRGITVLGVVLSACISCTSALPYSTVRAHLTERDTKPSYSVVPLEPGDDAPAHGGNGHRGHHHGDDGGGDDRTTVLKTVLKTKTKTAMTETVTRTAHPQTITKEVPTTISVVDISGAPLTTVTVIPSAAPTLSASASAPAFSTEMLSLQTQPSITHRPIPSTISSKVISSSATASTTHPINSNASTLPDLSVPTSQQKSQPTVSSSTSPPALTTSYLAVPSAVSSTSTTHTFDDGMWHTTYPAWNATTVTQRFQR